MSAGDDERLRGPVAAVAGGNEHGKGKGGDALDQAVAAAAAAGTGAATAGGGDSPDALKPPEASSVDIRIAMIGNVDR